MTSQAYAQPYSVASAGASERALFIRRTYMHVALAILGFVALSAVLWRMPAAVQFSASIAGKPLILLGAWLGISWLANSMAYSRTSRAVQYGGLALYTVLISVIFLPMMMYAHYAPQFAGQQLLAKAAFMTISLFFGLSAVAVVTRKDFSFLAPIIMVGGFVALGLIVCGMLFGFDLGLWFSVGMVALMAASILHTTSSMVHRYSTDMYVGAALCLFSSIAMMFFYILRIFMNRD
jgi:FtsH-binding integral membrane protein